MSLTLFDDIVRRGDGPADFAESWFPYLNRTGRADAAQVRELLENWLLRFPVAGRADLLGRFRSDDDRSFFGAFFELYMHEVMRRLGYEVELYRTSTRAPDFLCRRRGRGFYLEATVVLAEGERSVGAERRVGRAYDAINRMHCPDFSLWIEEGGAPPCDLSGRRIRDAVSQFVSSLNYAECRSRIADGLDLDRLPNRTFNFDGWRVSVSAIPLAPEYRGRQELPIGSWGPDEMHRVDRVTPLRKALRHKAGHYGQLDSPFVIAVSTPVERTKHSEVVEALFGTETYREQGVARLSRHAGLLLGPDGPQYTRVSGVVVAPMLTPWSIGQCILAVYPNPWAALPLQRLLGELPGYASRDEELRMVPYAGRGPEEIFGLAPEWPTDGQSSEVTAEVE